MFAQNRFIALLVVCCVAVTCCNASLYQLTVKTGRNFDQINGSLVAVVFDHGKKISSDEIVVAQ